MFCSTTQESKSLGWGKLLAFCCMRCETSCGFCPALAGFSFSGAPWWPRHCLWGKIPIDGPAFCITRPSTWLLSHNTSVHYRFCGVLQCERWLLIPSSPNSKWNSLPDMFRSSSPPAPNGAFEITSNAASTVLSPFNTKDSQTSYS